MEVFTARTACRAVADTVFVSPAAGSPLEVTFTRTLSWSPYRAPRGQTTLIVISRSPPLISSSSRSKSLLNVGSQALGSTPANFTVHSAPPFSWDSVSRSILNRIASGSVPVFRTMRGKALDSPAVRSTRSSLSSSWTPWRVSGLRSGAGGAPGAGVGSSWRSSKRPIGHLLDQGGEPAGHVGHEEVHREPREADEDDPQPRDLEDLRV